MSSSRIGPGKLNSNVAPRRPLRTTEQVLGVGNLGQADATAPVITGIWQ
jgi:hypothetical protein